MSTNKLSDDYYNNVTYKENDTILENVATIDENHNINITSKWNDNSFGNIDAYSGYSKSPDMTKEELAKEFEKFQGHDYMDIIQQFSDMSERDQKIFVLYSIFYFGLNFYRENIEEIMSQEVFEETAKLAGEFAQYGSQTGCDVNCHFSLFGPSLNGVGYNIISPLSSLTFIKDIDSLSISELAYFANTGYEVRTEEDKVMLMLNEERSQQFDAFKELTSTLLKGKNK